MPEYPHLTATSQLDRAFIETRLFPLCETLRNGSAAAGRADGRLSGLALYSLFYEPSLLTRTSFERAMGLLGGQIYHTEDALAVLSGVQRKSHGQCHQDSGEHAD